MNYRANFLDSNKKIYQTQNLPQIFMEKTEQFSVSLNIMQYYFDL